MLVALNLKIILIADLNVLFIQDNGLPLTFLKTSSKMPGFFDRSVVSFIHRVFGNAGEEAAGSSDLFVSIDGSMNGASPETFAILKLEQFNRFTVTKRLYNQSQQQLKIRL